MNTTYKGVVPYLSYEDAEQAIAWYERVFGFKEISRWTDDEGRIQNAEMSVGNTEIWLDGGGKRLFDKDGRPATTWIGIWVDDVDGVYRSIRDAGVPVDPPVDRDFGVRMLTVVDPEGYQWGFMRRI